MSINPGPFTFKQIFRFIGDQIIAEEGTEGPKILDSTPAKVVMLAYGLQFDAICSDSTESAVEQTRRMDVLYETVLSGNEHMCAFILINNLWHDHFEL